MSCRIPHFLYDTHGLVEEAGLLPAKAPAVPDQGKVLAGGAEGYHMDGRDLPPVQLRDVPQVQHVREVPLCDGDRGLLDLAGPHRAYAAA